MSIIATYANTAVGGIPYCFLKAVEKCDGFLNPTSAYTSTDFLPAFFNLGCKLLQDACG